MIHHLRNQYNSDFSVEKYHKLLNRLKDELGHEVLFRVAETPVFVPKEFKHQLLDACDTIFNTINTVDFYKNSEGALKGMPHVPGNEGKPVFFFFFFGVCEENGNLLPHLIEIQGFP